MKFVASVFIAAAASLNRKIKNLQSIRESLPWTAVLKLPLQIGDQNI